MCSLVHSLLVKKNTGEREWIALFLSTLSTRKRLTFLIAVQNISICIKCTGELYSENEDSNAQAFLIGLEISTTLEIDKSYRLKNTPIKELSQLHTILSLIKVCVLRDSWSNAQTKHGFRNKLFKIYKCNQSESFLAHYFYSKRIQKSLLC